MLTIGLAKRISMSLSSPESVRGSEFHILIGMAECRALAIRPCPSLAALKLLHQRSDAFDSGEMNRAGQNSNPIAVSLASLVLTFMYKPTRKL